MEQRVQTYGGEACKGGAAKAAFICRQMALPLGLWAAAGAGRKRQDALPVMLTEDTLGPPPSCQFLIAPAGEPRHPHPHTSSQAHTRRQGVCLEPRTPRTLSVHPTRTSSSSSNRSSSS